MLCEEIFLLTILVSFNVVSTSFSEIGREYVFFML